MVDNKTRLLSETLGQAEVDRTIDFWLSETLLTREMKDAVESLVNDIFLPVLRIDGALVHIPYVSELQEDKATRFTITRILRDFDEEEREKALYGAGLLVRRLANQVLDKRVKV